MLLVSWNAGMLKCQQKNCNIFMLVVQQPWQRTFISQRGPEGTLDAVCLDATGQTNQYRWATYALVGADEYGEAVPLGYCITSSEAWEPVTQFLDVMKGANPGLCPRVVVIDKSGERSTASPTGLAGGLQR